jgi:hypothetical protein
LLDESKKSYLKIQWPKIGDGAEAAVTPTKKGNGDVGSGGDGDARGRRWGWGAWERD